MAEIALEQVTKEYPGGVLAVDKLNLTIREGEILVLVGPSGCGKTTTLRLIAGLEAPTQGRIRIAGRDPRAVSPRDRDVALVFQRPAVYPQRSVRRNLGFSLELQSGLLQGLARGLRLTVDEDARVLEIAEFLGLADVLDRPAGQLSGGQQQRVALGRALVRRTGTILLDEPLAGLDAPLRLELRRELHLLHRRFPATMVYVTHDPLEALSLGDRVAVLRKGALQQVDTPEVVHDRPVNAFVAEFFGRAPTNFFDGCLVLEGDGLAFLTGERRLPLPPGPATRWRDLTERALRLGLRAEDVEVFGPANPASEAGGPNLETRAALVEPLGQGWLVTLSPPAGMALTAGSLSGCQRPGGGARIGEGEEVKVRLHLDRAHLFDRATGVALGRQGPAG